MPFRRVAEHLRTQNWAAVAIDFVIVVVGVYIGLQANDWKQQKLERESDQRALALFVDELDVMMVEASDDLNTVTANLEALALGTEIALNCDASMEERRRLAAAIANTLVWRIPDIRPSGLAEIGNSGTLHRLGNPELSRAVGTLNQEIKGMSDSTDLIGPQFDRAWAMLLPYLELSAPIRLQRSGRRLARQHPSEYMSLAPHASLCKAQEFLLGLSLLTDYYDSSVYSFDAWLWGLRTAHELAASEMK